MENWKRALLAGAAAASAIAFLRGKSTAGVILAGVSLATLASEYPESFAQIRERMPVYVERGQTFLDVVTRVGERMALAAESRGSSWYEELLSR